jgi:hypothetical protein
MAFIPLGGDRGRPVAPFVVIQASHLQPSAPVSDLLVEFLNVDDLFLMSAIEFWP